MRNGTTTPPGYVLPYRPSWQGGWNIRSVVGAAVAFVLAASTATEWLAIQLNNPVEMGDSILWVRGTAIFQPFAALVLWKHFAGSQLISSGVRKDQPTSATSERYSRSSRGTKSLSMNLPQNWHRRTT